MQTTYTVFYRHDADKENPDKEYRTGYSGENWEDALESAKEWADISIISDVYIGIVERRSVNIAQDPGWTPRP